MLLTPPRLEHVLLGLAYIKINMTIFACSYYFILYNASDDPRLQEAKQIIVCYGFLQSLIGFIAGLWLSRITQVVDHGKPAVIIISPPEEEMRLIEEENRV